MSALVNCSVCFDPLDPANGDVARTPCHHDYHVDCIDGYARNAFGSLTAHARCNRRDHTHNFTFEISCPNCRHGLPYRVNLLAANSLLPNGDVVPNFPMKFDTVEVLNTSGIPIARPDPTPMQQEIEEAIRNITPPAHNSTFGGRVDFAEVRMQAQLFAYYERRQSLQPEVAPQPTLNRTHADDIECADPQS